jgi:hypothetical protein
MRDGKKVASGEIRRKWERVLHQKGDEPVKPTPLSGRIARGFGCRLAVPV